MSVEHQRFAVAVYAKIKGNKHETIRFSKKR